MLTLNDLQGYQKFQDSDLDAKLGALDNFSNSMFQAGNLEEVRKAQDYRAQLEVDTLSSTPQAQVLAGVSQAIGGQRDLEFSIGTEAYDRINKGYSERIGALEAPPDILQVNPGEYVYTRPNPFGDGAMIEYDGGSKFVSASNPRTIKALMEAEKLPAIKKDEIFGSLVDRLTPIFQADGPTIGIETADQLVNDPAFQTLPLGDKRAIARRFRLNRTEFLDSAGASQGEALLQSLDKEYNAQQIMGAFAPENAPDEFPDLGVVSQATLALQANKQEWFTTAIDRGTQRWLNQWDLKAAKSAFRESDRLFKTFTPEQQEALKNEDLLNQINSESQWGIIPAAQVGKVKELLKGTALEGTDASVITRYAQAIKGFQKANENFILRGKALSLIPQTKGLADVQDVQGQLAQTDASWQYKAAITAGAIASHPLDVIANASLESFVSQPLSTVATAALFAIPGGQTPAAALATNLLRGTGTGLIAGITDSSYTYTEELNKARYNQDGTERPLAEVLADPVAMKQVNDNAFLHGVSVGTVEGVTGYLLPGIMNPLDRTLAKGAYVAAGQNKSLGVATKSLLFNAAEMGLQGTSEGGGELLGQVAQSKDPDIGSVLMEAASGLAGPDFFAMYQAPKELNEAVRQISTTEAAFQLSQEMIRKSEQIDVDYEQALAEEASGNAAKGVYARGFVPMVEIGPADATGMANVHAFYEEAALEGEPAPIATTTQGLEDTNAVQIESPTGEVLRDEEAGAGQELELQGVVEEDRSEVSSQAQAQPIEGQIQEGQEVSYLTEDGEVRSGKVENLDGGSFTLDGKYQSFRPGKYFAGVLKPKNNAPRVELGDVLFDGQNFWKSVGDDKFVHGYKQKGEIIFDDSDQRKLGKDVINDPRVDLYSKPDFDAAQQEYNGRENPQDSDRFTDLLRNTPQKQEPASAPTPPPPAEPVTAEGKTKEPTADGPEDQAVTDIQAPPIPKKRTTIFNLRVHKDTGTLLAGAVERMNEWMGKTKIFQVSKDQIAYAKDGKIQQLFRSQAPESFDETVRTLTEEDQSFRNHKDPTNWTEVPQYREMERVLQERVNKTASSKSKNKRQNGILKAAQVSSILQALFVQDRAIAAWVSKRFNLYTPNASLITVEDVAQLRYGNVVDWELTGAFGRKNSKGEIIAAPNSYDPMARLIQLTGNANITDVFHELYHDFLNTIAPIILDNAEYVRLQQFLEARLAQKPFREYLKKRYKNEEGAALTDVDFTFFNKDGNISVAAHEAFAQMMTKWHHEGRAVRGLAQEDQSVLNTITNFYVQTFQDLNRTPIATTTDDAHDLLSNFFLTPPLLRREAFKPENRIERINEEILSEELSLQELSEGIADASREVLIPEEQTLPAPAQIIGDKLVETYKLGQQPREGVPFTSGGHSYVLEGEQVYEIIESPQGPQKVARAIEDKPWDGQTVYPQVKNTNYSAGTREVSDENLVQTVAPEASKKPVIKTVIPVPETDSIRTILTDPDTGMVISDKTRKKRTKKPKSKTWTPPATPKKGPDNGFRLYSIEDDAEYKMGRMPVRINSAEFSTSQALKEIAKEEGSYRNAPTHAIIATVEARMNSKVTILDALRDIYKLRRMGPDQRARQFDPENKYEGIGNASVIYYLLALQSRLNLVATAQENGLDLDIDKNAALMLLRDVTRAVAVEQREAGRAVNINKHLLTYSPKEVIIRLQSDLIRNNKAFLNYVKKAQSFRAKYRQQKLTDSEFAIALKQEGFPEFMAPALRFYSKEEKASTRDFEKEAAVAWAREPTLSGHVRPESKANLELLSNAANNTNSTWLRDLYAQTAKLAYEAERGQGMIDGWNALFYNNILMAPGVAVVNVVGTATRIPLDFLAYDAAKNAIDLQEGKAEFLKNEKALVAGLNQAFRSLPEALTEFAAIAFSGQRGASVEAFTRAQGAIASTQTMLFARPGTWSRNNAPLTFLPRVMKILLFDSGRRVATVFDAFYKVFSENTILGAELYREAWDMYQAKPEGKKSEFIANYIDQKLNVKPLAFYQALANQELLKNGDLLLENSTTILPKPAELAVLRNIIAFNLRREARENALGGNSAEQAKRIAFGVSYSNEPRGAAKVLADTLQKFATVFGLSKFLGQISKTNILQIGGQKVEGAEYRQGGIEIRTRLSAGGALAPEISPFSGNVARMAEEFFNWTGLGTVNQIGTNYIALQDGKTKTFFENNPDTYTKTEIAAGMVKGALGTAVITSIIVSMGGDEEDDEKKHRGLTGFSDRSVFGRNGKETFVPAYSFWWRTNKGDINYLSFKDHPQLVATLGTAASYNERRLQNPDAPWFMMFDRISKAMWAGASESGTFDGLLSIADFLKEAQNPNEKDVVDIGKGLQASIAKYVKAHAVPLNRFQKETMAYSLLPGRGGEELMSDKEFFPTLYANTLLEGWLSPEDAKHLDRIIKPDGSFKKPNVLSRLGGLTIGDVDLGDVLKAPSPGLVWMRDNRYFINKTDYQRPISGYFTKQAQKEQAEAEFAQMNNGMFFVKHASEIEAKAQQYYWPWITAYSENAERKAEIDAFVNSETNQLKKRQNSPSYKTERDIQQADINSIVNQARSIGALQAASDYYTDNPRVKLWSQTIAIRKMQEGYKLDDLKTNRLLEQKAVVR